MITQEEGYCNNCDEFYIVETDEYGMAYCPECGEELDMVDF